jgi:hypothetical protein
LSSSLQRRDSSTARATHRHAPEAIKNTPHKRVHVQTAREVRGCFDRSAVARTSPPQ